MFNKEINLFYRFVCLILYSLVIIFTNSIITPFILLFFFFVGTRCFDNYVYIILYLLSIVSIIIYFYFRVDIILRIVLEFSYIVYFFNTTTLAQLLNINKKERKDKKAFNEYDYTHFNNEKKSVEDTSNLGLVYYMTFHLGILFISVLVGR